MGLDMCLEKGKLGVPVDWNPMDSDRGNTEQVAYWRNAGAIHSWFHKHVDGGVHNLEFHPISGETLERLVSDCQNVLQNPEKGPTILPLDFGDFFRLGSTCYDDDDYRENLKDTVEQVGQVLATTDFVREVVYYLAWW